MPGRRESEQARREQLLRAAYEVAAREGIDGLTVRAIAAEARVSHGLVHFHFETKQQLVRALLDRVLESTLAPIPAEVAAAGASPLDRLRAVLQREMVRLAEEPRRTRLFFEYWALGTRDAAIGQRIGTELERYRTALRAVTAEVLRADPAAFPGVTPDSLAAVAVSFVNGCAVQAMIDQGHFDMDEYLAAVRGVLDQPAPPQRVKQPAARR